MEGEREPVNEPLSFLSKDKIATCAPMLLGAKEPAQEHTLIKVPNTKGQKSSESTTNHELYKSSFQNVGTCFTACTTGTVCVIQTSSAVSQFADTMLDLSAIPHEREEMPEQLFFNYQRKKCSICI